MKNALCLGCALLLAGLTACGNQSDMPATADPNQPTFVRTTPKVLVQQDLAAFATLSSTTLSAFDANNHGQLTALFGGTTGADIKQFVDLRIHHYLLETDEIGVEPASFTHTGWMSDPNQDERQAQQHVSVGASNVGIALWLAGVFDATSVRLLIDGETVPIASGRTGIMLIGAAYIDKAVDARGNFGPAGAVVTLPAAFRQSLLVHEARHSDCTGGLATADVDAGRNAASAQAFTDAFTSQCGHLHAYCTSGDYISLPACDRNAWEAYGVGAVFLDAVAGGFEPGSVDYQITKAMQIDSKSRLAVDYDKMLSGDYGPPDMSDNPAIADL